MVVVLHTVFVTDNLAVQFVHELVHRSVQILMGALGKHVVALDMHIALGALATLLFLLLSTVSKTFTSTT